MLQLQVRTEEERGGMMVPGQVKVPPSTPPRLPDRRGQWRDLVTESTSMTSRCLTHKRALTMASLSMTMSASVRMRAPPSSLMARVRSTMTLSRKEPHPGNLLPWTGMRSVSWIRGSSYFHTAEEGGPTWRRTEEGRTPLALETWTSRIRGRGDGPSLFSGGRLSWTQTRASRISGRRLPGGWKRPRQEGRRRSSNGKKGTAVLLASHPLMGGPKTPSPAGTWDGGDSLPPPRCGGRGDEINCGMSCPTSEVRLRLPRIMQQ
mmetsp:Transcript_47156/g.142784  ORF Transcript_47156/g.142784 Transcript_47156/m.142784 type:complete len:262 (-) Transcript_47156:411-1196(-)